MINKNILITIRKETIIPIYYIDNYKDADNNTYIKEYKFKNKYFDKYLLNILIDICIDIILIYSDSNIIFTYPPSTMFYRKEKNIDSMGNLIKQAKKYLIFYWRKNEEKYYFKNIFSINKIHLKNNKAQHINGDIISRTKNLNQRYYINFFNNIFLRKSFKQKSIIVIIDDISSTGGTLLACKKALEKYIQNKKLNNVEILLYSIYH